MSKDVSWPCERCGTLRWLLLEKRLGLIAVAVAIMIAGVALNVFLAGASGRGGLLVAAILAGGILSALVRIRCVRCEPAWRTKAWKLAGRDLDGSQETAHDAE